MNMEISEHFDRLTAEKAKSIIERGLYKPCGIVLCSDDGDVCIVDRSAVRWLKAADDWTLMHPSFEEQCDMKLGYLPIK